MAKVKEIESGNVTSRKWVFNLVLFAVLFVVVIALFHTFVFSDRMLYGSDTIQAGVFFRSFYVDYVHENGSVPVWNPYQFCGIPYIDGFHGDTFYPFSILKFFTNIYRALGWNLLLHVFLAGITMFACARVFKKSQMAATLAAVGYMFAAYFVSQVAPGHDGKMFVTSLFPLTLMLIELAFKRKPLLHFSLLGLVIGIIILTPHPQMAYYTLWVCAFYVTFKLIFKYVDERSVPALIKPTGLFVVAVIIGLALSAIHFYPGYDYVKNYSPRSDQKRGEEWAKSWSLGPEEAASLIVPEFCGVSGDEGNSYWGRNAFKDNSEYAGAVPLMMALFAVVMIRSRKTWFFGGLALFAVIYGLAGNTWFFYLFYNLIPNVKSTRAWSMIMFLFSFSISLLAAFALDFIIEQSRKLKGADKRAFMLALFGLPGVVLLGSLFFAASADSAIGLYKSLFYNGITQQKEMILQSHLGTISAGFWKTFFFLIIPAAAIWLYSRKKVVVAVLWVVVAFALIDAYRFDQQFIRTFDQDKTFKPNSIVESIKAIPGKFRVLELTGGMLPTNYLPMFGIEELTSYHGNEPRWFNRLHLATKTNYRDSASGQVFPVYDINRLNNLADMTNTRYIMLSSRSPVIGGDPATLFSPLGAIGKMQIFENTDANERAFIVHNWIVQPDDSILNQTILSSSFNPQKYVGLAEDPGIEQAADSLAGINDMVTIETYANDFIALKTKSDADGMLVLGDNWYPAWKAFIDGTESKVYLANGSFRGVVLPAGEHNVEFRYISSTQRTGRYLTLVSFLFVLGVVVFDRLGARRRVQTGTVD